MLGKIVEKADSRVTRRMIEEVPWMSPNESLFVLKACLEKTDRRHRDTVQRAARATVEAAEREDMKKPAVKKSLIELLKKARDVSSDPETVEAAGALLGKQR